ESEPVHEPEPEPEPEPVGMVGLDLPAPLMWEFPAPGKKGADDPSQEAGQKELIQSLFELDEEDAVSDLLEEGEIPSNGMAREPRDEFFPLTADLGSPIGPPEETVENLVVENLPDEAALTKRVTL